MKGLLNVWSLLSVRHTNSLQLHIKYLETSRIAWRLAKRSEIEQNHISCLQNHPFHINAWWVNVLCVITLMLQGACIWPTWLSRTMIGCWAFSHWALCGGWTPKGVDLIVGHVHARVLDGPYTYMYYMCDNATSPTSHLPLHLLHPIHPSISYLPSTPASPTSHLPLPLLPPITPSIS